MKLGFLGKFLSFCWVSVAVASVVGFSAVVASLATTLFGKGFLFLKSLRDNLSFGFGETLLVSVALISSTTFSSTIGIISSGKSFKGFENKSFFIFGAWLTSFLGAIRALFSLGWSAAASLGNSDLITSGLAACKSKI